MISLKEREAKFYLVVSILLAALFIWALLKEFNFWALIAAIAFVGGNFFMYIIADGDCKEMEEKGYDAACFKKSKE